jgi:hypothetical protein
MNGPRRPASIADSKYKASDGHQDKYFHSKLEAFTWARDVSSMGSAVVCQRVAGGSWSFIRRYRFGQVS